jgi:hypothetical protein
MKFHMDALPMLIPDSSQTFVFGQDMFVVLFSRKKGAGIQVSWGRRERDMF